ncbi:MAG: hypothetical protein CVT63_06115 [Candidatus Anoxymicrobium japonicum]|uniref:NurA domain-containing protein n=1 Tax=Candidatus Anoxymicrobium japonicum TaxID=2013648 RepID=A0A2N3G509_9ACTN|nr:MAG: hypothetical protein CVT63_06115 [Candidatus Anoxymicrobium japonicum]
MLEGEEFLRTGFAAGREIAKMACRTGHGVATLPGWEDVADFDFHLDFGESSLVSIEKSGLGFKVAAVDGGSATLLDAGPFLVGARRTGYVVTDSACNTLFGPKTKTVVETFTLKEGGLTYRKAFAKACGREPGKGYVELEKINERLRELEELTAAKEAVLSLDEGDLLLIDGALGGDASKPDALFAELCESASSRKVHIAGVSKSSNLNIGGFPLTRYVERLGRKWLPGRAWFAEITKKGDGTRGEGALSHQFGPIYVAKLDGLSYDAFRIDISAGGGADAGEVFGKLARLCDDAAYPGYPYPLALAHNAVAFEPDDLSELRSVVQRGAMEWGLLQDGWDELFCGFHDILDMNRW